MNTNDKRAIFQFLAIGLILAGIKLVYLFFDPYNILDFIVFLGAGIMFGGKAPGNRRFLGLLLALPTLALCLLFVINNGYTAIMNGVGTSYAISLIVIPIATTTGLFINAKRVRRINIGK